jgi:hypothetical protein
MAGNGEWALVLAGSAFLVEFVPSLDVLLLLLL